MKMKNPLKKVFFTLLFLAIAAGVYRVQAQNQKQQEVPISQKSYFEARRVLEAAMTAYGGREAVRSIENFSVKFDGANFRRNQSLRPEPPYDRTPLSGLFVVDIKNGRLSQEIVSKGVGGFDGHTRLVTDGKQGAALFLPEKQMTKLDNPAFSNQRERLRWLPHNIVLEALGRATNIRSLGTTVFNNRPQDVVTYATEDGQQLTLYFDAQTHLMSKFETIMFDVIINEMAAETIFPEYRTVDGKFKIPTGRILRRAGEVIEEISYDFTFNKTFAHALFQIPEGFTPEPPAPQNQPALTKLADEVYLVRAAAGYNVMFVVFRDYILVLEAPINDSASNGVIAKIKETAPNKPVKYVVVTHHHTDHSGGVRAYVREGANIVTTPGNKNFFTRMVEDVFSPSLSGRKPIARRDFIETFSNKKRVFTDGKQTVELYDIGRGPHADEMVVAYLPNEKMIFQGDLFNPPDDGRLENVGNATTKHFAGWLEKSKLAVEKIVAVHGRITTPDEINHSLKSSR